MTRRQPRPAALAASSAVPLPPYAQVVRTLPTGLHPYLALLPEALSSPAMCRIMPDARVRPRFVAGAKVRISSERGFAYVDDEEREIIIAEGYYRRGAAVDLYLDLLHELTHIRQLDQGKNLWDESLPYPDRPTEVEGYAVAVEEGRRLGMSEPEIVLHLTNPWMSAADIERLHASVVLWLRRG
ncbi:MAG: hypothetical protein HY903_19455 [Deltaproteobacteria bacterium]|nr:hypothetical protein [Deltaproteobacteria bacterium]